MISGAFLGSNQLDPLPHEHSEWTQVASAVDGVTPLEAKAFYAVGLLRHLIEASGKCLDEPAFELPAYVLAAEAAEALGRLRIGNRDEDTNSRKRLDAGLLHAMAPATAFTTQHGGYDVAACRALRNFTTHGATTPRPADTLDHELTVALLQGLARAVDRCWVDLGHQTGFQTMFATALLRPLWVAGTPVFVVDVKHHMESGRRPTEQLMYEGVWR
jgi:hypothetical protein